MIKNIVFDLGGVIIDYNPEKTLKKYFDEETCEVLLRVLFRNSIWLEMDRGTLTVAEAMEQVRAAIPPEVFDKTYSIVEQWGSEMPPFEAMHALVAELKEKGYGIYLLSNAPTSFHTYCRDIPALALFDGLFISADYHLVKPEKEIYEAFLNKFSLKAEECFFVDDMPANIEGARAVGINGHRHDGDVAKLREVLAAL